MATVKPRCTITCDSELYEQLEDYRFTNRYQSDSTAAMALLRLGLQAIERMSEDELKAWVEETKSGKKNGKK